MALLYDRRIRVNVAGLTIEELRMTFVVERAIDPSQNGGEVVIYNLGRDTETLVYERADTVRIEAGYPQTQALVFDGFAERILRVRERLARQVHIKLGDAVRKAGAQPVLSGITTQSIRGPVRVVEVVQRIARDIGLPLGPLDAIPPSATVAHWVYTGPAGPGLTAALRGVGCTWFEADGIIRINRPRLPGRAMPQSDAPTVQVSRNTGLIDRPIETDDGAEVVMLLNPAVVIGCRIELDSDALKGAWKVVALRHEADNWRGGSFTTWVDLRALG